MPNLLLEISGDNSRKEEEMESKQNQHPAVDVTGVGSKVQCCKEPCCIGTWNVPMNKGKLEVVKKFIWKNPNKLTNLIIWTTALSNSMKL